MEKTYQPLRKPHSKFLSLSYENKMVFVLWQHINSFWVFVLQLKSLRIEKIRIFNEKSVLDIERFYVLARL